MRGFLVLRPGALGDSLVAIPALVALRRRFPKARLVVAGHREAFDLARPTAVDLALRFDDTRLVPLFTPDATATKELAKLLRGIDHAIVWMSQPSLVAPQLERLGKRVLAAPPVPNAKCSEHTSVRPVEPRWWFSTGGEIVHHLIATLLPLRVIPNAAIPALDGPVLRPRPEDRDVARDALRELGLDPSTPFVIVHPGSGGAQKRWPAAAVATLCETLQRERQTVLLEGPADADAVQEVLALAQRSLPVLRGLRLSELLGVLSFARGYIGMDSGVSHLAGMAGIRTVAIFGPSNSHLWAPYGPDVRVVDAGQDGGLAALPTSTVLDAFMSEPAR